MPTAGERMMRRTRLLLAAFMLTACVEPGTAERVTGTARTQTFSSMNYAMERVDPACALAAVRDTDGFAIRGGLVRDGGGSRFTALFRGDLPLTVIVRPSDTSEISVFTRLPDEVSPLKEREAEFAVRAADEAIYRACTEDGRADGSDVIIEAE